MHANHTQGTPYPADVAPSRRSLLLFAVSALVVPFAGNIVAAKQATAPPKQDNQLSPDTALKRLIEGNDRYVQSVSRGRDLERERRLLVNGQNPYAAVLSCADSRVAPELVFDSGLGDLFVCRLAGNFVNDDTLGSLEYAVAALNTPLIMVLGHDHCGAIDATINSLDEGKPAPGHIRSLVSALAPAVRGARHQPGDSSADVIRQNVIDNVNKLKSASPILNPAVEQKTLKIVGGLYRLETGRVDVLS
ncbi:carbonic anhydrase [Bradyrhizobium acaciae]|uniref:carbonic anhydrase n=1 Tax=Bradyrhizobium acaciae TaxID=2683706 RepID=UPI001E42A24B|nr:carbonic anhydrase [Bradyrhizobium acaciae]MCC8978955.1 carbonic anhydrase [Bradyrhizobium acaciae]